MAKPKYSTNEIAFKKSNVLGTRIRILRADKGWSQEELANELSNELDQEEPMKPLTISSYETGKRLPTLSTLLGLSNVFDVSVDYLLGSDVKESQKDILKAISVDENTKSNPVIDIEYDVKIAARDYEKYHGNPVFVKANSETTLFNPRWGLLDYYENKIIFAGGEFLSLSKDYVLYRVKPSITSILETSGVYPYNLGQLMQAPNETYIYVQLINADAETRGKYDGYYRHTSKRECLINVANGCTLPYTGLGISYIAYNVTNIK